MKASELRLGNYVNVPIPEQCPFRIDDFECLSYEFIKVAQKQIINGKEVHPLTWYGDDLQPIPLTEEWLEKFGFTKAIYYDVDQNYYVYFDFSIYNFYDEGWFFLDPDNGHINTKGVKYVHEIQNLYFALTGEELILKSE